MDFQICLLRFIGCLAHSRIEGLIEKNIRTLLMGGILLSLAGWTRPEGIGFVYATAAALFILYGIWRVKARLLILWLLSIGAIAESGYLSELNTCMMTRSVTPEGLFFDVAKHRFITEALENDL